MSDGEPGKTRAARVSRFDRPPPPHDWRWWVGGLGKVLIVTGLLMFGFVAYQLWGTGIETARAQSSLENEFEDLLAATPPPDTATPVDSVDVDDSVAADDSVPADSVSPPSVPETTAPPPAPTMPPIADGDAIARIELPRIGVDKIVVAGVDKSDLKKGPGHYPDTPMPGQLGNSAIAGHRTTFGQPFYDIDKMQVGDEIIVTTIAGRFVYRVNGQQIVSANDYQVIATVDPDRATLTLTSCHPKYTAQKRIIITADLDEAASTGVVGVPTLNYGRPLDNGGESSDDIEPTNTITDPAGTAVAAGDGVPAGADTPAVDEDPTVALDDERIEAGIADAFSDGWFSDPGANGQVALWALVLAAVTLASYLIARKARRYWVGIAVGIGPFLVTLYFFYQNVNRLLPPNL